MQHQQTKDWVGICGLREINWDQAEGEFGIIVHPSFWRQGYSVEAHLALLDYSFATLKLRTIKFMTDATPHNPMRLFFSSFGIPFIEVKQKFMMVQARDKVSGEILPKGGEEWQDLALYRLERAGWPEVRKKLKKSLEEKI